jgi:hypothetical protein
MEVRKLHSSRPAPVIGFVVIRSTLGAIELVLPELTPRWSWSRSRFDRRSTIAIRLLGGRQLGQALLMFLAPEARVATAGAAVDAIHAASMLGLAMRSIRWRRPALVEAAVATGLAAVGVRIGSRRLMGYPPG